MSYWTYVKGIVEIDVPGRTQPEIEYIIQTIVAHLPKVTGSEHNMDVYIQRTTGHNTSSSCDEFGYDIPDDNDHPGGWMRMQSRYIIIVDGCLRDRCIPQTFKEFMRWLTRLAKRVWVDKTLVQISGYTAEYWQDKTSHKKDIIISRDDLHGLHEDPSWATNGESVAWWEYLMWDAPRDKKDRRLVGKPDFPDGRWIEDLTKREREKRFGRKKR